MIYACMAVLLVILVVLLVVLFVHMRRQYAAKKVCRLSNPEKCTRLNEAVRPYGFGYDPGQDLFVSLMHPWQRKMGYSRFYDDSAPLMNMVIQSEPIYFSYDDRSWLIELWKGQYGMCCGAEIGVYVAEEKSREPERLFYRSVEDKERLSMGYTLLRNGERLLKREAVHWWLTAFLPGKFSEPERLSMELWINFPNAAMRNAFYDGLRRAGYQADEIRVKYLTVSFCFCRPKSSQPVRNAFRMRQIQKSNRRYCRRYRRVTDCFESTLDRMTYLSFCFPLLYRKLIRINRIRSLVKGEKRYRKRKRPYEREKMR